MSLIFLACKSQFVDRTLHHEPRKPFLTNSNDEDDHSDSVACASATIFGLQNVHGYLSYKVSKRSKLVNSLQFTKFTKLLNNLQKFIDLQ